MKGTKFMLTELDIKKKLSEMTLEQKLGHLIICRDNSLAGGPGKEFLLDKLRRGCVGGIQVPERANTRELIAEAKEEIEQLHREADKAISFLKKRALEEGREEGYQAGQIAAMKELEEQKLKWKEQEAQLEAQFQRRVDQLEVQFIETITGIYEEIFCVDLVSYKPILMNAISNTIRSIEGARDFIIHVSKEDYKEVIAAKGEMIENMISKTVTVEIVEDITLKPNECMIETSSGIYDCGIGPQVSELKRRLRLLSYEN
jgi:flagellar assembly protein FliH